MISNSSTFFESLKVVLIKMIAIFMMSAKFDYLGFVEVKVL